MNKQDLEKFFQRLEELLEINGWKGYDLTNAEIILKEKMFLMKKENNF